MDRLVLEGRVYLEDDELILEQPNGSLILVDELIDFLESRVVWQGSSLHYGNLRITVEPLDVEETTEGVHT